MISFKSKEASLVAELTKDIAMKIAFGSKDSVIEKYGNIYGYLVNYTVWFADVLLHCDNQNRIVLVNSFLEKADFIENDNVEYLLKWLIQRQEIHGKVNEFWSVWEAMKPRMIEVSHKVTYKFFLPAHNLQIYTWSRLNTFQDWVLVFLHSSQPPFFVLKRNIIKEKKHFDFGFYQKTKCLAHYFLKPVPQEFPVLTFKRIKFNNP